MKPFPCFLLVLFLAGTTKAQSSFDIFSYKAPNGFVLKDNKDKLFFEKQEGKTYCQLYLWPAIASSGTADVDFERDWNSFAVQPYSIQQPEHKEKSSEGLWTVIYGGGAGSYNNINFVITVGTYTNGSVTYSIVAVFNHEKHLPAVENFAASVIPDPKKFTAKQPSTSLPVPTTATKTGITKAVTNFNDGWVAKALNDYVQIIKGNTEVRLHYVDKALDDAKPNTINPVEYYWNYYVTPFFNVSNLQKWSGMEYPVIYHLQANAVNKQTGKPCYIAMKIIYQGGARPVLVISADQNSYLQQFPHPNDIDPLLSYNKFAVTANDIIGQWKSNGGGIADYYNAYNGSYAFSHSISTTDEFNFNKDGSYNSVYRSADMAGGFAQFGGQDFKGTYTVTDWTITATNRHKGRTATFTSQLIAVKGGYLLWMQDTYEPLLQYTLFKSK